MAKTTVIIRDGQRFTSKAAKPWQSVIDGDRRYHGTRAKAVDRINRAGSGRVFFMTRPGTGILTDHLVSADANPAWKALMATEPAPVITIVQGA